MFTRFRAFASFVKFLLDNVRLVRVGTTNARRKLLYNLREEKERLEARGFEVGPKLLADHFGVSEEDVKDVQRALASRDVSLDAPVTEGEERTHGEALASGAPTVEEDVARKELQEKVQSALARFRVGLPDRELVILDEASFPRNPPRSRRWGTDLAPRARPCARRRRLMAKLKQFLQAEFGDLAHVRIGPR